MSKNGVKGARGYDFEQHYNGQLEKFWKLYDLLSGVNPVQGYAALKRLSLRSVEAFNGFKLQADTYLGYEIHEQEREAEIFETISDKSPIQVFLLEDEELSGVVTMPAPGFVPAFTHTLNSSSSGFKDEPPVVIQKPDAKKNEFCL